MKKRIGLIALCIALCCAMLPVNVMAAKGAVKIKAVTLKKHVEFCFWSKQDEHCG